MAASDHLGEQFTTWYHGTGHEAAASIQKNGLTAQKYGFKEEGYANKPTVTADRAEAETYARNWTKPGRRMAGQKPVVVEMHIPSRLHDEYLAKESPDFAGLHKPLPKSVVRRVHEL